MRRERPARHRRAPRPPESSPGTEEVLRIERIAAGGDGVARASDGMVVFVPRTAPGDLVRALVRRGRRMARGSRVEILEPGPARVEPPCAHYTRDRCGGCQLQHLRYDAQLEAKRAIVRDALTRIGRARGGDALPAFAVEPSAAQWRYRRKLTLALRRRDGRWVAGLHPYDDPGAVFALRDCPITEVAVMAAWREVMAAAERLPPAGELRGAIRLDGGASLVIEGGVSWSASGELFERCPSLSALWWVPEGGARHLLHERGEGGAPGASFAQVNAGVAQALAARVLERALAHEPRSAVDAYAGLGDTAVALAERGVHVVSVELDEQATRWCAARLPEGSRAVAARVEDVISRCLPADVVVLNPPRAGVDERVTTALEAVAARPRGIVYVSCDPATLARDVARLPSYRVATLAAFDMFPQTAHVETVCELVPREGE